jgi:hypothetical protein
VNEHDREPVPGLPARLPPGETILWQGAPTWRALARHTYHADIVGGYFVLLLVWSIASSLQAHAGPAAALRAAGLLAGLGLGAVGLLCLFAWLTQRTTLYTITTRRVVMRFGIALPMTVNLPFLQIAAAGVRLHADGTGDLPLSLAGAQRAAYLIFWPHVRPWRMAKAEPMLRGVPNGERVARILSRALAAAAAQPAAAAASDAASDAARQSGSIARPPSHVVPA